MNQASKTLLAFIIGLSWAGTAPAQLQNSEVLNEPLDISADYSDYRNTFYLADELVDFDPATGKGTLKYLRHNFATRQAFNNMLSRLVPAEANEFPGTEYAASPELPFEIQFITDRTLRIKTTSGPRFHDHPSLMLVDGKVTNNIGGWTYSPIDGGHRYTSAHGRVDIMAQPWHVTVYDADGKLLTSTLHMSDVANTYTPVSPFGFIRRARDYSRSMNAVFTLSPNEKIFGCGESFTQFNKRGQKVVLFTDDANGVQNETMYKPIPFYLSSRGYGVFMHHSTPITIDFGKYFNMANSMMIGDDEADLFVFIGEPKDILDEYTDLTGKAAMPPLWSFGFWMSRITYFSEAEGREVTRTLREKEVPCDVLHFDTGWFEVDWRNDYQFSADRFDDPEQMMKDFQEEGFRVCLWQLPYFTPKNTLFDEIVDNGLAVRDPKGNIPYEDAVLDFSNPATIDWYQAKIKSLLEMGVDVIKVDFGEAAPVNGLYHSGRTGFYEHNLYPLRYNKAVADITEEVTGDAVIWARSAWAGSQRYPLHWGGDAATTNTAMAATLRGGLSFGLSGFSFWSHDIGGFTARVPEDLYRRWTPFGMLSSHVRSHGHPPTEPWEYGEDFLNDFREADNMRYRLMPYIYTQAKLSSEQGLPMLRALFVEYPNDPGSWLIDDQYLFGSDILVAPLFEEVSSRDVYLPPGQWIDYQTGETFRGGWHHIAAGGIPVIMLVKAGSIIPHIGLAQSTQDMDWSEIELKVYSAGDRAPAVGSLYLPGATSVQTLRLNARSRALEHNPFGNEVNFTIRPVQ